MNMLGQSPSKITKPNKNSKTPLDMSEMNSTGQSKLQQPLLAHERDIFGSPIDASPRVPA